MSIIPMVSSL